MSRSAVLRLRRGKRPWPVMLLMLPLLCFVACSSPATTPQTPILPFRAWIISSSETERGSTPPSSESLSTPLPSWEAITSPSLPIWGCEKNKNSEASAMHL